MLMQIAVGSALLILSITLSALGALLLEIVFARSQTWLLREPHRPKLVLIVAGVTLWALGVVTVGVWLWAMAFFGLGVFATLEECVYFSLTTFATLGLGDVILPFEWRLLAGMEAANGLLNFGLLTALLVEALRHVHIGQIEVRRKRSG